MSAPMITAGGTDQASRLRDLMRGVRTTAGGVGLPDPPVPPRPVVRPRARVLAVTSGKGGVGKTNLSVNLAARFAAGGRRTVLLDADLGLANADVLCGVELRHNLAHVVARRKSFSEVVADTPAGFRLVAGASGLAKMADLPGAEHDRLIAALTELEAEADLLVIDTGAGISPNVLSFLRIADHVLVVTTPEPTAITDAYATIKVLAREDAARGESRQISVVVNQVRSATEARGVYERLAKVCRQFLSVQIDDGGYVPADPHVGKAVRERRPFLLAYPRCAASVCVSRLAVRLESGLATQPRPRRDIPGEGSTETLFARLIRLLKTPAPAPT